MAIEIKNIPVLTGKDADYFNNLVQVAKDTPLTKIPEEMKAAFKSMEERSLVSLLSRNNLFSLQDSAETMP